jgi:hypothetical protein
MRCIISIVKVFLFLCSIIHLKVHKDLNRNHGNESELLINWMVIRFLTSSGKYIMHIQERTSSTI